MAESQTPPGKKDQGMAGLGVRQIGVGVAVGDAAGVTTTTWVNTVVTSITQGVCVGGGVSAGCGVSVGGTSVTVGNAKAKVAVASKVAGAGGARNRSVTAPPKNPIPKKIAPRRAAQTKTKSARFIFSLL